MLKTAIQAIQLFTITIKAASNYNNALNKYTRDRNDIRKVLLIDYPEMSELNTVAVESHANYVQGEIRFHGRDLGGLNLTVGTEYKAIDAFLVKIPNTYQIMRKFVPNNTVGENKIKRAIEVVDSNIIRLRFYYSLLGINLDLVFQENPHAPIEINGISSDEIYALILHTVKNVAGQCAVDFRTSVKTLFDSSKSIVNEMWDLDYQVLHIDNFKEPSSIENGLKIFKANVDRARTCFKGMCNDKPVPTKDIYDLMVLISIIEVHQDIFSGYKDFLHSMVINTDCDIVKPLERTFKIFEEIGTVFSHAKIAPLKMDKCINDLKKLYDNLEKSTAGPIIPDDDDDRIKADEDFVTLVCFIAGGVITFGLLSWILGLFIFAR